MKPFIKVAEKLGFTKSIRLPTQIEAGMTFLQKKKLELLKKINTESDNYISTMKSITAD